MVMLVIPVMSVIIMRVSVNIRNISNFSKSANFITSSISNMGYLINKSNISNVGSISNESSFSNEGNLTYKNSALSSLILEGIE